MGADAVGVQKVAVVGAGAWGTALAQTLCLAGRDVLLWAHERATADEINTSRTNAAFLPNVTLDPRLRATAALSDLAGRECALLVTPAQHVRVISGQLAQHVRAGTPLVICAKGIEQTTGALMGAVLQQTIPHAPVAVLSGPSFAGEVARGLPCAVTVACADEALGRTIIAMLGHATFRPYWSDDVLGVQIGGAVKNVLAIAAGIVVGRELGASAHAAMVTRGFAEMVRFGQALGAKPQTLMGLAGFGDLLLTCGSTQSRNMSLGRALAQACTVAEALGGRRSVAEGVYTAQAIVGLAEAHGIEMPICRAVDQVLSRALTVTEAIDMLLARPFTAE